MCPMATTTPEALDILEKECTQLSRCGEVLEGLYYTCGASELAIEQLLRPNNPTGLDYKSVTAQMKNMKDILDKHMQMVRLIFVNMQKVQERLKKLKAADNPEMVEEVNRLHNILLDLYKELKGLIKQGVTTCRRFHLACKIVLDYVIKSYCQPH